jgi:predicted amidohydrolase
MANHVKIATVAPPAVTETPPDDFEQAVRQMSAFWREQLDTVLPDRPDVIVLPECCDRFARHSRDQQRDYYRFRGDRIRDMFAQIAREHGCYIAYSAVRQAEGGTFLNSTQLIDRQGDIAGVYHKNHITIYEGQDSGILCGAEPAVVETDFGRVGFAICFDLNFDPLREQYKTLRPDLILFSSMYHGGLMQAYWAYSCRCHLATAVPGRPSGVINPVGEPLGMTTNYYSFRTVTANLDCQVIHIDCNGVKFADIKRKYGPRVSIFDPGHLGAVLLTSEADDLTVDDVIADFELERIDDYFDRALRYQNDPAHIEGGRSRSGIGAQAR